MAEVEQTGIGSCGVNDNQKVKLYARFPNKWVAFTKVVDAEFLSAGAN